MKLSMKINYSGDFHADVQQVVDLEKAGLDVVWVAEAYSFDAVQPDRLPRRQDRHGSRSAPGILNVYSRTATLHGPDRGRLRLRQSTAGSSSASAPPARR